MHDRLACTSRFPSVAWRMHSERLLVMGWGRAILLQFAHPLVAAGVADHSSFQTATWGRLRRLYRTVEAMLGLTFGTLEDAVQIVVGINTIHDRVHGHLWEAAGRFPAGTPYAAHDPALLRWVHTTSLDSNLLTYESFVTPLTAAEKDAYCAESAERAHLLGIPRDDLPRSTVELQRYMEGMFSSGQILVTSTARALAQGIVYPPTLGVARPLVWLTRLATVGLLPATVRMAYGYAWDTHHERALRRAMRMTRTILPCLPSQLRYWRAARLALRALHQNQRMVSRNVVT